MRSSHISRQRSPTQRGSGGWALQPSMTVAQDNICEASTQPPM